MSRRATLTIVFLVAAMTVPSAAEHRPQSPDDTPSRTELQCGFEIRHYLNPSPPVVFRFDLQNTSFEPQVVDLGYDREGALLLKLERPDGSWVALAPKTEREGISRIQTVTIQPKEKYSQQFILDDWYKFTEPGSYRVSLIVPKTCPAMELEFEIPPLDVEELNKVCSRLVDEVRKNKDNYEKSSDMAKVLAKVDNPIVVPFLMKALEANPMVDSILIPALERIGDKQAVDSLISLLGQHDSVSLRYELVRPALVRLEPRSALEEAQSIRIALARFPAP